MTRRADRMPLEWLACALCCLALFPSAHAAPAKPVPHVCADPHYLPFSNRDGLGLENALVQLLARDVGWASSYVPPAGELGRRGIATNVVGCSIYGDYSRLDTPRESCGDVTSRSPGSLAGYFAGRAPVPLVVNPIEAAPDRAGEDPLRFAIVAGVRHGDAALKRTLQAALDRRLARPRGRLLRR